VTALVGDPELLHYTAHSRCSRVGLTGGQLQVVHIELLVSKMTYYLHKSGTLPLSVVCNV